MGSQGWFEHTASPLDAEGCARHRAETERLLAESDARAEHARLAEFGEHRDPVTESVVMPLSGRTFQWRTDGFFRVVEPDAFEPGDEQGEWQPWDIDFGMEGTSEAVPGDTADATWSLWWGLASPEAHVAAWLADDADVPITRLGHLWIAEWRSPAQSAFVSVDGTVTELEADRPDYLPPARLPFRRSSPDPRSH